MCVQEIHDEIMSSDYEGCSFDPVNIDALASVEGGIIVALMGNVVLKDNVRRMFHQTFFLATQPFGYFVMNDILRFSDPFESEILSSSNGNDGNVSDVPPDLNQGMNLSISQLGLLLAELAWYVVIIWCNST